MLTEEEKELLDNADPEAVKRAFIDALREDEGERLRALLHKLRMSNDPDSRRLYRTLTHQPELHDLLPH
jgi:hypothetical protein